MVISETTWNYIDTECISAHPQLTCKPQEMFTETFRELGVLNRLISLTLNEPLENIPWQFSTGFYLVPLINVRWGFS